MTSVLILSVLSLAVAGGMHIWGSLSPLSTAALWCGLEGTILLASALSPPPADLRDEPKGVVQRLLWPFAGGRGLRYPIEFNPVFFYGGFLLLATSMVLGTLA